MKYQLTEEQKEKYRAKAREYKRLNKEKIKAQRKEYDIQYYKNLSEEQKEKRKEYKRKYDKSKKSPRKIKNETVPLPKKTYSEIFFEKAKLKHGNRYDYSLTQPINSKTKIKIICSVHGVFEQTANDHLHGHGCRRCGGTAKLTTEDFITKAKNIHGEKYDYSESVYTTAANKLKIICPIHGEWYQKPNNHLSGKGCKKCGFNYGVWNYSLWEQKGLASRNFDSFKLYVIECWDETERFYKIGKTFKSLKDRFDGKGHMPYDFNIIKIIEGAAKDISELEVKLKNENKNNSYLPKKSFNGRYECFHNLLKIN